MNHRRGSEPPLGVGDGKVSRVQVPEIFSPQQRAVEIVAEQTFRSEKTDEMFAIGGRRGISVGRFGVALDFGYAFVRRFFPENSSIDLVQTEDLPALRRVLR